LTNLHIDDLIAQLKRTRGIRLNKYLVKLHFRYTAEVEVEAETLGEAVGIAEAEEDVIEEYSYYDSFEVDEIN